MGSIQRERTAALALIEAADAALASEIRELVIEVVGASRSAHAGRGFGGASSFMLWGSVLLNTEYYDAKLDMMAALLHETAHQLLFGLSLDQPVVENDVEERYASPLRPDPRPMDGIFHATFVCARMHYGYARLMEFKRSHWIAGTGHLLSSASGNTAANFLMGSRRSNTTDVLRQTATAF